MDGLKFTVNIGWYSEEAGHAHVIATIHDIPRPSSVAAS